MNRCVVVGLLVCVCGIANAAGVVRFAVMSDIQGYPYPEDAGMRNLERALDVLAPYKPDAVLSAGDIADTGRDMGAVRYFKARCDARLGKVPHVACMGNHELDIPPDIKGVRTREQCLADFNAAFAEDPSPLVHKVICGYDVIALSMQSQKGFVQAELDQLKGALDKAVSREAKRPVFVLTHYHPLDTVNASGVECMGDAGLRSLLEKYPQVVNLSGHTHNPLQDPRSIWQGAFTVVETSTLCYGCIDERPPKSNQISCLIPYGHESVGCLLIEVSADRMVIRRFSVRDRSEIDSENPWSFALPYDPAHPKYDFASRAAAAPEPRLPKDAEPTLWYDFGFIYVMFNAAENADDAYAYRIELNEKGGKTNICGHLSDFYRPRAHRSSRVCVRLPSECLRPGGSYRCRIVPVGFFGREGRSCDWSFDVTSEYPLTTIRPNVMQE